MEEQPTAPQPQHQSPPLRSSSLGAKRSMYSTSNQQYGTRTFFLYSAWLQSSTRPQSLNLKTAIIPTYAEILQATTSFKKTQKLIKAKILRQQYLPQSAPEFNQTKSSLGSVGKSTIRQFPIRSGDAYKYPTHGMKVGSLFYKTSNMGYGDVRPSDFEIPAKYLPYDSSFTTGFNGGINRFNGLNTAKTVSQVHNTLNEF